MPFPFEAPFDQVEANLDYYVDQLFGCLTTEFLQMPKGPGFVEYQIFEAGYETLKKTTKGFREVSCDKVVEAVYEVPVTFIVLRAVLGFTPSEWAYVASERTNVEIKQNAARTIDRKIRMTPLTPSGLNGKVTRQRIQALVETACKIMCEGVPENANTDKVHRLEKADTKHGLNSVQPMADLGVPYPVLLYERFLGRPFAGHRDSVSELVGDVLETAIEDILVREGVSYRKTKRAERITGFDQTPDFIIPNEFNPQVVIEAKVTEDDGTARDKVTRVQHLGSLSTQGLRPDQPPKFQVIACIAGRGFKVRREDMKKLLVATRGKVFTMKNLEQLVLCSRIAEFKTR